MRIMKHAMSALKEQLYEPFRLARLERKFLTCMIYAGAFVDTDSRLGKYVEVKKNAKIIDSTVGDYTCSQPEIVIKSYV